MPTDNPVTLIIDRLWEIVEGHDALTTGDHAIKPGNRIKVTTARAVKGSKQDGDYPQLMIVPTQKTPDRYTSSSIMYEQDFEFHMQTGDTEVDKQLGPVEFELTRAFEQYAASHGRSLGLSFVADAAWMGGAMMPEPNERKARAGWYAAFVLSARVVLNRTGHVEATTPAL